MRKLICTLLAIAALAADYALPQGVATRQTFWVTTKSDEARTLFFRAWDEGNRGNRTGAVELLGRVVQLDSAFGLARLMYARLGTGTATPQERVANFERALLDAAANSQVEGLVARSISALYATPPANMLPAADPFVALLPTGQTLIRWNAARATARMLADSAARIVPDDPYVAYYRTAISDSTEVDADLRRFASRFPSFAVVHHTIAQRKQMAGDTAGADLSMREYLRLAPTAAHAHYSYGRLLLETQRASESIPHFAQALRIDSTAALHWEAMGSALSATGNYPDAVRHLRRAIAIEPAAGARYRILANIHLAANRPDSAIVEYNRSVAALPAYMPAYNGLAGVHAKAGSFDDAIEAYRLQSERTASPAARTVPLTNAAHVMVMAGKWSEALTSLEQVVRMAEQIDASGAAGLVQFRDMGLIAAVFGDSARAKAWFVRWSGAMNASLVNSTGLRAANVTPSLRTAILTQAFAGSLQDAKANAAKYENMVAESVPVDRAYHLETLAVIAVLEGDLALAKRELDSAGSAALLGKAIYADALNRAGRVAEARAIRDEVLGAPFPFTLSAHYAIAIAKVRAIR
jgi:tetratricopeptide (TPR) repeat protein